MPVVALGRQTCRRCERAAPIAHVIPDLDVIEIDRVRFTVVESLHNTDPSEVTRVEFILPRILDLPFKRIEWQPDSCPLPRRHPIQRAQKIDGRRSLAVAVTQED